MSRFIMKFVVLALVMAQLVNAARILGVFPYPSHSHQVVFRALTVELSKRGHELVIFTTFPLNDPQLQNYTEIDLHSINEDYKKDINFFKTGNQGLWSFLDVVYKFGSHVSDKVLGHPVMQEIISRNNTQKFDLILMQCLYYDALYSLSIRLNAPMIGISSLPLLAVHHYMFGNPLVPAYSPDSLLGFTDNMNFWDRITNTYYYLRQIYEYRYVILPTQDGVLRKYFGNTMPPIEDLSKNFSLLLVNTHPFYSYPRPNVPAIIDIGGCRSGRHNKSLSNDLKQILDDSKAGFIYFSLGSNIKSDQLPATVQKMLFSTFAELPYTVLWKFESDHVHSSKNVILRKWLPQPDILSHPNIVLFMYQGGLQSTEEAIENGVPMIGFPVFSDQIANVNKLHNVGAARKLDLGKVEKRTLKSTILEVVTNSSYKENIIRLRDLLRDLPYHPMEQAVWWTEHVIRHKGAPHLYNRSRDLPWYKSHLLDMIAISFVCFVLLLGGGIVITRYVAKKVIYLVKTLEPALRKASKKND